LTSWQQARFVKHQTQDFVSRAISLGATLVTNSLCRAQEKRRMCANERVNSEIPVKLSRRDSVDNGCSLFAYERFRETPIGPAVAKAASKKY